MFSSLDACGSYLAVRIEPGSRACTELISSFGTFQYIQMPFGLANTGSVYCRMLDVGRSHEGGGGQRFLNIIPWWYPDFQRRTIVRVLPDQLHSDNGKEFVNNLWRVLLSEFKIQNTTTPPYNPSSNPVERFHRTIFAMLRTRGARVQGNWDLWINEVQQEEDEWQMPDKWQRISQMMFLSNWLLEHI